MTVDARHAVRCLRPGCDRSWPCDPAITVACPACGAREGIRCRRPSGHRGPFVAIHADRDLLADREGRYGNCPLGICGVANRPLQPTLPFD